MTAFFDHSTGLARAVPIIPASADVGAVGRTAPAHGRTPAGSPAAGLGLGRAAASQPLRLTALAAVLLLLVVVVWWLL